MLSVRSQTRFRNAVATFCQDTAVEAAQVLVEAAACHGS